MIDLVEEWYYDAHHVVFFGVLGLALGSFDRLGICFSITMSECRI